MELKEQAGPGVRISGTGAFLPGDPIPFDEVDQVLGEFEGMPADFDKWYKRTRKMMKQLLGIDHYFYAIDRKTGETTEKPSTMAAKAAEAAIEAAGIDRQDVDLLIYCGASQDTWGCPPTSAFVQEHLGIKRCAEYSIHSNCTSTYKGLQIATDMINYGRYNTVLLTSANMMSHLFKASSFNTKVMTRNQAMLRWFLSDGAGAAVLVKDDGKSSGLRVLDTFVESVGYDTEPHMFTRWGSASSALEAWEQGLHHLTQDFHQVSQRGAPIWFEGATRFCNQIGLDHDDPAIFDRIKYFLANVPADHLVDLGVDEYKSRYKFSMETFRQKYYSTVANRGYTGPAAILITLNELVREKKLTNDDLVMSFVLESSKWMDAGFAMKYRG